MKAKTVRAFLTLVLLTTVVLLSWGCQAKSPEERVAGLRARYVANLNGWIVREPPAPEVEEMYGEGADPVAMEAEAMEAEMMEEDAEAEPEPEPMGPEKRDILLDIDIHHTNTEMLAGITLDVSHVDAQQQEKGSYLVWVDTSGIMRGQHVQVNHVLEGIEFEAGDMFAAEVRHPIPPGEIDSYREFREDS